MRTTSQKFSNHGLVIISIKASINAIKKVSVSIHNNFLKEP